MVDFKTSYCKSSICMHGEKIHAYGMHKLEQFCAHCRLAVFSLLLPKISFAFAQISGKAMANSGKSNGKFGQKQWENLGKSNEKTRKAAAYFSGKNYYFFPNFPLLLPEFSFAFSRISHCFCPNFPLLLPEFPTAFARIFRFQFFFFGGGGTVAPLPPPPPPTPMHGRRNRTMPVDNLNTICHSP